MRTQHSTKYVNAGPLGRIFLAVSHSVYGLQKRRHLRSLLGLPDYLLKDIGVTREIVREQQKWFWEE